MWTVTTGTTSGVSATLINQSITIVQGAAAYWSRYIDDSLANLSIRVNFIPLSDLTLAQAGTDYFFDRSAGGFDFFEAITITELRTGVDENGSQPDIEIDIDTGELLAGEFHLGPLVNGLSANIPFNAFDLFTIIVHEIGHGLGILSFIDSPGNDRTDFDERVFQSGGNFFFNGSAATSVFGGTVPLDDSIAHLSESTGSLLGPVIAAGEATLISRLDVAVLQDIGVPVRQTSAGNDLLWGFAGDETINGAGGNDTLNAFGGLDQLFGGDGNDVLNANDSSIRLDGGAGADTLNGSALNDSLVGGQGADQIDGNGGFDSVDYESSSSGISINLLTGVNSGGDAAGDVILEVEQILGSLGADNFAGDGNGNWFTTNGGGDFVDGGAGNDTLSSNITGFVLGVDPMDTLIGGAGADQFIVNSTIGAVVSYSTSPGSVFVSLPGGVFSFNDAAGDSIGGAANLEGSQFNDTLTGVGGGSLVNGLDGDDSLSAGGRTSLIGGAGADTLVGSTFDDTLVGGNGDDLFDGGAGGGDDFSGGDGFDIVSYASASGGVSVNLTNSSANAGAAASDTVRGDIEGVVGGAFGDFLQGNSSNNNLVGNAGNDTLIGGFGDDTLAPGAGADSVNGGDGFDIATYSDAAGAVRVALWNPASNTGEAAGDTINFQIEVVEGSAFADNLQGNTSDNNLRGGAGNDLILGGFGSDTLLGGSGGDDFGGGDGFDVVSYADATAAVRIALWNPAFHSGDALGDNIRADVEVVAGSGFNDSLEGSASNNNLRGGGGADRVLGGGGDDTLWGQAGNDTLTGGAGNDRFVFDAAGGADRIVDFIGGPGLSDLINLTGFGAAFDSFAEVTAVASQNGADVIFDFGAGRTFTLANTVLGSIAADDFVYS